MFIHKKNYIRYGRREEIGQENEFGESQMNDMENEEVKSEKHHEESHKKKDDKCGKRKISNWRS